MGYPIQLVGLEGQRVLLAGGGPVAAEKIVPLIHAGARVHLVTLDVSPEMEPWLADVWRLERRPVRDEDVVGAKDRRRRHDDSAVNRRLVEAASARGILAQAADDKPYCDFYSPAVVRRGATSS
jgi:precorrin-2 dehydrogenase / sirohydrochlorin ferrochelatase